MTVPSAGPPRPPPIDNQSMTVARLGRPTSVTPPLSMTVKSMVVVSPQSTHPGRPLMGSPLVGRWSLVGRPTRSPLSLGSPLVGRCGRSFSLVSAHLGRPSIVSRCRSLGRPLVSSRSTHLSRLYRRLSDSGPLGQPPRSPPLKTVKSMAVPSATPPRSPPLTR